MTACSEVADYDWLTSAAACALLDDLSVDRAPLHTAISRLRRHLSPTRTHLVVEQVDLRRRAAAKFSQAHRMFFTRLGLEQATDEWVAAYKAAQFAERAEASQRAGGFMPSVVADLCCGIGGDLIALARRGSAVGVDRDPIAAHFAAANSGATVHLADATQFDFSGIDAWHVDPDRRPAGRRTTSLQFSEPDLTAIERLLGRVPHSAVKLAPATKVPDAWVARCELEWISRDHECRQLIAWHGNLAHSPSQFRATVVPTACGLAPRSLTGAPDQPIPLAARPDRYIFDFDPAVLAAKLKGALAAEHGVSALSSGPTYLTGPRPIDDAALACFEVADVLPLQLHKLAAYLRERGIGALEIKTRGVEIAPDKLRCESKLRGDNSAVLLITPIAGRPTVILSHRLAARGVRSEPLGLSRRG